MQGFSRSAVRPILSAGILLWLFVVLANSVMPRSDVPHWGALVVRAGVALALAILLATGLFLAQTTRKVERVSQAVSIGVLFALLGGWPGLPFRLDVEGFGVALTRAGILTCGMIAASAAVLLVRKRAGAAL